MSLGTVRTMAGWELRGAARSRWVVGATILYAVAAAGLAVVGLRSLAGLGLGGVGMAAEGLLALGVLLPPLVGLLLGAGSLAGMREQGALALIASQPITRRSIAWGTITGLTLAVWSATLVGIGLATAVLAPTAGLGDIGTILTVTGATLAAGAVGVALGVCISALSSSRSQATAIAAATWFLAALGADLLLAAIAPAIRLGAAGMLWAILLNPLETIRIAALAVIEPASLGPFGVYLDERFGSAGGPLLLAGAAVAWIVIPTTIAAIALKRRDV